jgi:hypothetical protein
MPTRRKPTTLIKGLQGLFSPVTAIALLLLFAVVSAAVGVSMLVGTAWTLIFLAVVAVAVAWLMARGVSRG